MFSTRANRSGNVRKIDSWSWNYAKGKDEGDEGNKGGWQDGWGDSQGDGRGEGLGRWKERKLVREENKEGGEKKEGSKTEEMLDVHCWLVFIFFFVFVLVLVLAFVFVKRI